jgi:hypothetical protein
MTTEYTYPFSSFPHGVNLDLLGRQIVDAVPPFVPTYQGASTATDVTIYFSAPLSAPEQTELDGIVAVHNPNGYTFAPNYKQDIYTAARRLQASTWFALQEPDGTLLYKVEESLFTYDASDAFLLSENVKTYDPLGSVTSDKTYNFVTITNADGSIYIQRNEA